MSLALSCLTSSWTLSSSSFWLRHWSVPKFVRVPLPVWYKGHRHVLGIRADGCFVQKFFFLFLIGIHLAVDIFLPFGRGGVRSWPVLPGAPCFPVPYQNAYDGFLPWLQQEVPSFGITGFFCFCNDLACLFFCFADFGFRNVLTSKITGTSTEDTGSNYNKYSNGIYDSTPPF